MSILSTSNIAAAELHPSCHDELLIARALAPLQLQAVAVERLRATALVVDLPAGPIQHPAPDHPVRALWLLRSGELALGGRDRHARFTEMRRVKRGEWVDVFGALGARPEWFHDMTALCDSEVLALPVSTVMQTICADPAAALAFGQVLLGQAQLLRDGLSTMRNCSFGSRLARRLLDETAGGPQAQPSAIWTMRCRKQNLAQQLDVSSETLSRGLRALCDAGLIVVRGYDVQVLDRPALSAVASTGNLPGADRLGDGLGRRAPRRRGPLSMHAAQRPDS